MVLHLAAAATIALTPQQKAALVVVSGLPAPRGVGGVIVRRWDRTAPRPRGALVFVDQEGGAVRAFPDAPPWTAASSFRSRATAFASGRDTARGLLRRGVDVDLAPVVDLPDGPLGSRHFRSPAYAIAFARGLAAGGAGACVKHFPGLGSAPISTDLRPRVDALVRPHELAAFRAAIRARVPCVMISNAFYGGVRASISAPTYRLLRAQGFTGVAITDSLSIFRDAPAERWSRQAIRSGADLLLFTSPVHARRAIAALVPLARRGDLDASVARFLQFRANLD